MMPTNTENKVTQVTVDDVSYHISLPNADEDYIQKFIFDNKTPYELELLHAISGSLSDGDVFLDIGANIGNHSLYIGARCKAKIIAFEPNKSLVEAFRESISLNDFQDFISIYPFALGAEKTAGSFKALIPENIGAQSILIGEGGDLEIETLDSVELPDNIKVVKIDVEGMELDVLKGAVNLLKNIDISLFVECASKEDFSAVEAYLHSFGFLPIETFNATPTHQFKHSSKLDTKMLEHALTSKISSLSYEVPGVIRDLKNNLHEANLKYRNVNKLVVSLREELSKDDRVIAEVGSLGERVISNISGLEQIISNQQYQSADVLDLLQKHGQALFDDIIDRNSKIAGIRDDVLALSELKSTFLPFREQLDNYVEELSQLSVGLLKNMSGLDSQIEEKHNLVISEIKQLNESSTNNQREGFEELQKELNRLTGDLKEIVDSQTVDLSAQIRDMDNSSNSFNRALRLVEESLEQKSNELEKSESSLRDANKKYREATTHTIPTLKNEVEALRDTVKGLKEQAVKDLRAKQDLNKRLVRAHNELSELRNSIMFQLGETLVLSVLSVSGFVRLPIRLSKIFLNGLKKAMGAKPVVKKKSTLSEKTAEPIKSTVPINMPAEVEGYSAIESFIKVSNLDLRVACVMDEFTYGCYAPTCNLFQVTPDAWREELDGFQPQLLFIESAWRGKNDLWGSKIGHNSKELREIVDWCKSRDIPTLFWNKEDPIHFQTFLNTARHFDYVFTTDLDCISRYKSILGHNKVFLLPFACQPLTHNPIQKFNRKRAISFAGAYYVKYPERTRDLDNFFSHFQESKALEIFDRNFGKTDSNYQFPENYKRFIVGSLPFDKIDAAYKGYEYAINLNSIKQSQTMFARRVFELLGSNTLTISNFSKGIRLMFGDLVLCSDDGNKHLKSIDKLDSDKNYAEKLKLKALRKTLQEHTYQHRLAYIAAKTLALESDDFSCEIAVIAIANSMSQYKRIVETYSKQTHANKKLIVVVDKDADSWLESDQVSYQEPLRIEVVKNKSVTSLLGNADWVACFKAEDYYGENYLTDLSLATTYLDVRQIGKGQFFTCSQDEVISVGEPSYQLVKQLSPSRSIIAVSELGSVSVGKWFKKQGQPFQCKSQFSIDRFNYCKGLPYPESSALTAVVDDIKGVDEGVSIDHLNKVAEQAEASVLSAEEFNFSYETLKSVFEGSKAKSVSINWDNDEINLSSSLNDGAHEYIYAKPFIPVSDLYSPVAQDITKISLFVDTTLGLSLSLVLLYFDENETRISHDIVPVNRNETLEPPESCQYVRLGFRALSGGNVTVNSIVLGERDQRPSKVIAGSDTLLITNNYPSYQNLYKNGFVHSRVRSYIEQGKPVDVFRFWNNSTREYYEFEGVDVSSGGAKELEQQIIDGQYKTILVHFLDQNMWQVLSRFIDSIKVVVWLHGAEIHPWYRRKYNIETVEQENSAKAESDIRMAFWKSILKDMPANLQIVFVSRSFSEEVFEDLGFKLPKQQYQIIHNPIDTDIFKYRAKDKEHRKKILSIRPFASKQYANDVAVGAIVELSKRPFFRELEFRIIGDGKLFEDTVQPIKKFDNVIIERKFLSQLEIATLHQEYGVFLCPSRWDSQGVSRDEAMSSGLVPISTHIAAIPEFVSESSGVLVEPENPVALAEAVERLYREPELFCKMSAEASLLIKSNREKQKITKLELGVAEPKRVSESDDSTTTGKLKELSIQLRNSGINEEERLAIYNELTSILWSEGRYEEAKICLDICQSIAPDNLDIQDQIKDLNEETIPSEYVMEGLEEEQKNFVRRQKNYLRYPEVVQIETLAVCNAGCSFCPYPTMERKGDKMAIELFDKIILDLKTQIPKEHEFSIGLNHINEPLADSRWSTFVAKIEDDLPNARVTIITNGYLLHAKNIERLMSFSNISSIQVSLNEINKQKHEQKMHMRGKFEQIVSNLDNLHAALLGSDKELPIYLRRVGDYTENDQEFISYCSKRWPKFHVASRGLKDFLGQVDLKELSSETGKNLHNDEVPIIGCSQWYHIVISASGKVATCCFDGNVDWPIGDVNQTSVLDIYHSESLSRLRDVTKTRLEANSPCNTCNIHWGSGQKNAVYNYKP